MNAHVEVPTNPVAEDRLSRLQETHATIPHNFHNAQVTHKKLKADPVCIFVPFQPNDRVRLIYDAIIYDPTNVLDSSFSAIEMNVPRLLHELAK